MLALNSKDDDATPLQMIHDIVYIMYVQHWVHSEMMDGMHVCMYIYIYAHVKSYEHIV